MDPQKINLATDIVNYTVLAISILIWIIFFNNIIGTFLALFMPYKKWKPTNKYNRHAIVIPAHNEQHIVGELIKSLLELDYPRDKYKIFVVADNCTDDTAKVAREMGADFVYERFNKTLIGPNFAVHELLVKINEMYPGEFDSYCWFDADNIVAKDWLKKMNDAFNDPKQYDYLTSFRDTENFSDNWISACNSIQFLWNTSHLQLSRRMLGIPYPVTGAGFMIRWSLLEKNNYWGDYTSMVHDTEFSYDALCKKWKGAHVDQAVFYDLQPTKFNVSYNQRTRWTVGNYKLKKAENKKIVKDFFKPDLPTKKFAHLDFWVITTPAYFWFFLLLVLNIAITITSSLKLVYVDHGPTFFNMLGVLVVPLMFVYYYLTAWFMCLFTYIRQAKKLKRFKAKDKFVALFSYPIFMFLNVFISIKAKKNMNMNFVNTPKERTSAKLR